MAAQTARANAEDSLVGTEAEQAALRSLDEEKYIRAREQAEAILALDPDAFVATWVLANVMHYDEGSHPRALFLVRKCIRILKARFGEVPELARARKWHRKLIEEENWVLSEMDRNEEQVALLRYHDTLYQPSLKRLQIWPLMKMERYEEAEAIARALKTSNDVYERVTAYNGLLTVADELENREATYSLGIEGIERTQGRSCILFFNTAQSALLTFRFAEAEGLAKRALRAEIEDCGNSGYVRLATLYLLRGDFQKVVSSLKAIRKIPIEKHQRQQYEMTNRSLLVLLLYSLGRFSDGSRMAGEIYMAPDRTGMSSLSEDEFKMGHGLIHWMLLDAKMEAIRESMSVRSLTDRVMLEAEAKAIQLKRWRVGREVLRVASAEGILVAALRPYMREMMPWYSGALVPILGAGVVQAAMNASERLDADHHDKVHGYYEALEGEIAWRDNRMAMAIEQGHAALEHLPQEAVLLRLRTSAWLADALEEKGAFEQSRILFQEVLQNYPTALRHLHISLPVEVTWTGGAAASRAADGLRDARRLRIEGDTATFVVHAEESEGVLAICLRHRNGFEFACVKEELGRLKNDQGDPLGQEDAVIEVLERFQRKAFAPRIALSQHDINSLDGSPIRVDADRVLEDILGTPEVPKP